MSVRYVRQCGPFSLRALASVLVGFGIVFALTPHASAQPTPIGPRPGTQQGPTKIGSSSGTQQGPTPLGSSNTNKPGSTRPGRPAPGQAASSTKQPPRSERPAPTQNAIQLDQTDLLQKGSVWKVDAYKMTIVERHEGSFKAVIEKDGAIVENLRGGVVGTAVRGTKESTSDKQRTEVWGYLKGKEFEMKSRTQTQMWRLIANVSLPDAAAPGTTAQQPITDALTKGSIWRGVVTYTKPRDMRHAWEIHVTERTGEYFKADIVTNFQPRKIEGILKPDGHITWGWDLPRGIMSKSNKHNTEGTLKDGRLEFKQQDTVSESTGSLSLLKDRTDDPYRLGDFPDLATVIGPIQSGPQVWREVANLMSFPYLPPDRILAQRLPLTDRLYVPFRSVRLANSPQSGYAEADNAVLYRFDQLVAAASTDEKPVTLQARELFQKRLKIAQWNQKLGNTPDTSLQTGLIFLGKAVWKFKEYEDQVREDEKQGRGPSPQAKVKYQEFRQALTRKSLEDILNFKDDKGILPSRIEFSTYMLYRDFEFANDQADIWSKQLLPIVKKNTGPRSPQAPVELIAHWRKSDDEQDFQRLSPFELRNATGKPLTNVTVEVILQNKWGETARHYYFFPELPAGSYMQGMLNPWWDRRILPYATDLNATLSVWSDQASYEGKSMTLTSPKPCPNPESLRETYSKFSTDKKVNAEFKDKVKSWSDLMLCSVLPEPHKP